MFTGIIESLGTIKSILSNDGNLDLFVASNFTSELKIDQSVSHNGICLTVVAIQDDVYRVTAIAETIEKTAISNWNEGMKVNLERGLKLGDRLDGHIVQGHVDQTGTCIAIEEKDGSWQFTFSYDPSTTNITIEKGSITVNGVSLTVVDSQTNRFSVAIIPFTYEFTTFQFLEVGSKVNLEFDVIGKYVARIQSLK